MVDATNGDADAGFDWLLGGMFGIQVKRVVKMLLGGNKLLLFYSLNLLRKICLHRTSSGRNRNKSKESGEKVRLVLAAFASGKVKSIKRIKG